MGDLKYCEFCGKRVAYLEGNKADHHLTYEEYIYICHECYEQSRPAYGTDRDHRGAGRVGSWEGGEAMKPAQQRVEDLMQSMVGAYTDLMNSPPATQAAP